MRLALLLPAFLVGVGCLRIPTELAADALDYTIDRPRVVGIKLDPPVLAHGLPVRIDGLVVAPPGQAPTAISLDICGLRTDIPVDVYNVECFDRDELVDHVGDRLPTTWDPPDLSGLECGDEVGCASHVQLLLNATFDETPAFGVLDVYLQSMPWDGTAPPLGFDHVFRQLSFTGTPSAGGEIALEFRIGGTPDGNFRWYVDDGTLLDTGRTTVLRIEDEIAVTRNRLVIPDDWHGPMRIFVVAQSVAAQMGLGGDQTWAALIVEVP